MRLEQLLHNFFGVLFRKCQKTFLLLHLGLLLLRLRWWGHFLFFFGVLGLEREHLRQLHIQIDVVRWGHRLALIGRCLPLQEVIYMRESVIIDLVVVVSFREVGRIIVSLLFTLRIQSGVLLGERHVKQASRVSFSPTCARLDDTPLVLLLRDGVDVAAGRCPSLKDWLGGDILYCGFSAPNHALLVL